VDEYGNSVAGEQHPSIREVELYCAHPLTSDRKLVRKVERHIRNCSVCSVRVARTVRRLWFARNLG